MRNFFLVLLVSCICPATSAGLSEWKVEHEERLIKDKFLSDAATAESLVMIRPPGPNGTNLGLKVEIDYSQPTIHEVDESNGYITMSLWERLTWTDSRLAWKEDEYSGVQKISILPKYIWLPDVSFYSATLGSVVAKDDHHEAGTKAIITSDGTIMYIPKRTARFYCSMDVTFFPFDNQTCTLHIGSWVHHKQQIDFKLASEGEIETHSKSHHTDWTLTSATINIYALYYPCCPEEYQNVELTIKLDRRSEFFYYIFLVPVATMNVVLPFIHFFPPTSSQKTTLAGLLLVCSMILHLMVYQQLRGFAEEKTPVLIKHFDRHLTMIVVSVIISSITSSLANITHTTWRVPLLLRRIITAVIGKVCCFGQADVKGDFIRLDEMNQNVRFDSDHDSAPIVNNAASEEETSPSSTVEMSFRQLIEELKAVRERRQLEREWYQIALIIDRIAGIVYIIYTISIFIEYKAEFMANRS